jgi:phage terminase small subunit
MGARGPSPKPTAILKLRGSRWAKERERDGEMKPETGRPVDPDFRNDDEQRAWNQLLDQLEAIPGLLTVIDGPQLERYATYLVRWRLVENELQAFRTITKATLLNKESRQMWRLLSNESRALDLHLKQIEEKFGLTPSARTRIKLWNNVGDAAGAAAKSGEKDKARFFA